MNKIWQKGHKLTKRFQDKIQVILETCLGYGLFDCLLILSLL